MSNTASGIYSNTLICGDNIDIMPYMADESFDMVFTDPPYCSGRDFMFSDIYSKEAYLDDKSISSYIDWFKLRLFHFERVLVRGGVCAIFCDHHACPDIWIEMINFFGRNNYVNDLVWHYETGGASRKHFSRKHDTILVFGKSGKLNYTNIPKQEKTLTSRPGYKKIQKEIYQNAEGKWCRDRIMHDVLSDPKYTLPNKGSEQTPYPTQKSISLCVEIISAFCPPNGIVLDPFYGSGSTILAAHSIGRKWVGIDCSPMAKNLTVKRFKDIYNVERDKDYFVKTTLDKEEEEHTYRIIQTYDLNGLDYFNGLLPSKFQDVVCRLLGGTPNSVKSGDGGIDGIIYTIGAGIQVKKERIGGPVIRQFAKDLELSNLNKGVVVGLSKVGNLQSLINRIKRQSGVHITVFSIEELIARVKFNLDRDLKDYDEVIYENIKSSKGTSELYDDIPLYKTQTIFDFI